MIVFITHILLLQSVFIRAAIEMNGFSYPERGTSLLHLQPPEIMYRHGGQLYVPIFTAIVAPTQGASETSLPTEKWKDIWQDTNKNIIINARGEVMWAGTTNPRHQIDFAVRYTREKDAKPRIREMLVPFSKYQEMLDLRYLTTEDFARKYGLSVNVDTYLPNQLGFTKEAVEILKQYALPETLTTYVLRENDGIQSHEGIHRSMDDLRRIYGGIPDIPGFEYVTGKAIRKYASMLDNIEKFTGKRRDAEIFKFAKSLQDILVKKNVRLNNNFLEQLESRVRANLDLDNLDAWKKEAHTRRKLFDDHKKYELSGNQNQKYEIKMDDERIKDISSHPALEKFSRDKLDAQMSNILNKQRENVHAFEKRRSVLQKARVVYKLTEAPLKSIGINSFEDMLAYVLSKEGMNRRLSPDDRVEAMKMGFMSIADFDENTIINGMSKHIGDVIEDQNKISTLLRSFETDNSNSEVHIYRSNDIDAARHMIEQGNVKVVIVEHGKVFIDGQESIIVAGKDTKVVMHGGMDAIPEFSKAMRESFVPYDGNYGLKSLAFDPGYDITKTDINMKHYLNVIEDMGYLVDRSSIGDTLEFDPLAKRMFQLEDGTLKSIGTPRVMEDGAVTYNDRVVERKALQSLNDIDRARINERTKNGYTGIIYTDIDDRDQLMDSHYLKKTKSKYTKEVIVQAGNSPEETDAAKFLFDRYKSEGKDVIMVSYAENGNLVEVDRAGKTKNPAISSYLNKQSRITIIGHGNTDGDTIRINGHDFGDLIDNLLDKVNIQEDVGKISLLACTDAKTTIETDSTTRIVEKTNKILEKHGITSDVSMRVGKVQVDDTGRKQYGVIAGSEMNWQYREKVLVVRKNNDRIEYFNHETNDWTINKPEIQEGTKVVITKTEGNILDLSTDSRSKVECALHKITSGELGAPLPIPDRLDILESVDIPDDANRFYLDTEEMSDVHKKTQYVPNDETGVQGSIVKLEAKEWNNQLSATTSEVLQNFPDPNKWSPLIDSATKLPDGYTEVKVLNVDTQEIKIIKTKSDNYVRFKKRTRQHSMSVKNLPSFTKTSLGMTGTGSLMGVGFFIQSIIQMSRAKDCEKNVTCPETEEAKRLTRSLKIHAYIGLAEGAFGTVVDSIQITELAVGFVAGKKAVNGIATVSSKTAKFLKFSGTVGKVGMGVGAVGSVVGLGFSSYQLHHAQTHAQKVQFGVQVAMDSLNVIASGVAIGASIAAAVTSSALASSVAAAAGPVGFVVAIVGVLTSTITALVFEFKATRNNARKVGEYFFDLDEIYARGGFDYDFDTQTLTISQHAIVKMIDAIEGRIVLDSQYIYRTKHGWTGSGKKNYFFYHKHFPKMVVDRSKAINIREQIGYPKGNLWIGRINITNVVLPVVPKSYIKYEYGRLPFCTAMKDKGFDVLRRLERDYRFDYDFYITPGEQIIDSISHEYVETSLRLKVDDRVKYIIIPLAPPVLQNKYTYTVESIGKMHHIVLADGVSLILHKTGSGNCTWYIDVRNVTDSSQLSFTMGQVIFNKARVKVINNKDTLILTDNFGVRVVDPFSQRISYLHVTKPSAVSASELRRYLQEVSRFVQNQEFIVINDFEVSGMYVGRAYYEVAYDRYLYSDFQGAAISKEFKSNVEMLGKIEDNIYFMSQEKDETVMWRTHAYNHSIASIYNLFCGNQTFNVTKLYIQEGSIMLVQKVQDVGLIYRILPNEVMLISIDGSQESVNDLGKVCFPTLVDFLPVFEKLVNIQNRFPGECVYPKTYPVLPLKQTTADGLTQHFWFYMNDTPEKEYVQDDVFCKTSLPPISHGVIAPNFTAECDDLTLRDIQALPTGEEVYFFFCEQNKTLHYQVGSSFATEVPVPDGVQRIEDFGSGKYIRSNNGGLYLFKGTGEISLAAITFNFINKYDNWREMIQRMANSTLNEDFILVLDMRGCNGKLLTSWYDVANDKLVIVSPELEVTDAVYVGPTPDDYLVWLYDRDTRSVILQQLLKDDEIDEMITTLGDSAVWNDCSRPYGRILTSELTSVEFTGGSLFCLDPTGILLSLNYLGGISLLGVNRTWVKSNNHNLHDALTDLCLKYDTSEVITMGHESISNTTWQHRWFHCGWFNPFSLSLPQNADPTYLGHNTEIHSVYIAIENSVLEIKVEDNMEDVDEQKSQSSPRAIAAPFATVQGRTLALQAPSSNDLEFIPTLDSMVSLVIATATDCNIHISTDVWWHYQTIMITGIGSSGPQKCTVQIDAPEPCTYYSEVQDGDTVFYDKMSEHTVVLEDFTLINNGTQQSVQNQAVMEFSMCSSEKMPFGTSRDRLSAASIDHEKSDFMNTLIMISICLGLVTIFGLAMAWACRKRPRHSIGSRSRRRPSYQCPTEQNGSTCPMSAIESSC